MEGDFGGKFLGDGGDLRGWREQVVVTVVEEGGVHRARWSLTGGGLLSPNREVNACSR